MIRKAFHIIFALALLPVFAPPAHAAKHSAELFLQTGHAGIVRPISFSPDGKRIASGSDDNTLKLWDSVSGELLRTIAGHASSLFSVTFSPDSKQIVSGSEDKTVKLWDSATGELLKTLSSHASSVYSVSFSPDGKWIASGSDDNTLKLWDSASGKLLKTLSGHASSVFSVSFSPDGKRIASGSKDNTMKLWDSASGKLLKTLSVSYVSSVSFSPDGKRIASGSRDTSVKLWDSASGELLKTFSGHASSVFSVSFSPDCKRIASGSEDNTMKLWDSASGKLLKTLSVPYVSSVSFSPDGKRIASGSRDNSMKLWDSASGELLKTLSGHASSVFSMTFNPDGKQIAIGSNDKTVKLWDSASGELLKTLSGHASSVFSVSFSPDGKRIASGSEDKTLKLWDNDSGELLKTLSGHASNVSSVTFSPDGKRIASGSKDKTLKLWDSASGELLKTFSVPDVSSVSFSPDGKRIASNSLDKTVKLWDSSSGELLKTLTGHASYVFTVSFSPDGKRIASCSWDNTVKLWDSANGELLKTLTGHASYVFTVSFSPDGKRLASGSGDNTVKLWDSASGELLKTLSGHTSSVYFVSFSPDGKRLASGSGDNTVKLWDSETGKEQLTIAYLPGNEWSAFRPEAGIIYYNCSLQGDEYMAVRFDNKISEAYPLRYYRDELKRQDWQNYLSQPQPDIRPKPIRRWWDRLQNKGWKISSLFFGILMISAFIIVLRRRSDPFEVSSKFFAGAGFKVIPKTSHILCLFSKNDLSGMVLLWQEQGISELTAAVTQFAPSRSTGFKLYLVCKTQSPEAKPMQELRESLRCEVIPILSSRMEMSLYSHNFQETLKELEEPFSVRTDPYSDFKPIGDPTWFYGRDAFMKEMQSPLAQGQHIGIFGLRKVGKTSLIKQIRQRFVNLPTAYIDCQSLIPKADVFFEEISKQLRSQVAERKIRGIPAYSEPDDAGHFGKRFLVLYEAWKKAGGTEPFLIILDEIDKFFPNRKLRDSEDTLSEYVRCFKVLRGLAQSHSCLTLLVISYRPDVNRQNIISETIGENPMFGSFQEKHLGFLSHDDSTKMIREIGGWKDIFWEQDAARRVFDHCGGHPFISRHFASMACDEGSLKRVDYEKVEQTAEELRNTFHLNEIGNYYKEGVWETLYENERKLLGLISRHGENFSMSLIPHDMKESLANLQRFGLVAVEGEKLCLTASLFGEWLALSEHGIS